MTTILIFVLSLVAVFLLTWSYVSAREREPGRVADRLDEMGLMIIRQENYKVALRTAEETDISWLKSGAANNVFDKEPKQVRKLDYSLNKIVAFLTMAPYA